MTINIDPSSLSVSDIGLTASSTCIASRVRRMSRIITRIYDDALRQFGITGSQFTLLTILAQRDGVTAVEIGFDLDIEKSTLSRNLQRLVVLGLVDMDPPAGRRGRGLHLTAAGEEAVKQAYPVWNATQDRVKSIVGSNLGSQVDLLLGSVEKLAAA